MNRLKTIIHRLRRHRTKYGGKATTLVFLSPKHPEPKFHIVAYVCDECRGIVETKAYPNTSYEGNNNG